MLRGRDERGDGVEGAVADGASCCSVCTNGHGGALPSSSWKRRARSVAGANGLSIVELEMELMSLNPKATISATTNLTSCVFHDAPPSATTPRTRTNSTTRVGTPGEGPRGSEFFGHGGEKGLYSGFREIHVDATGLSNGALVLDHHPTATKRTPMKHSNKPLLKSPTPRETSAGDGVTSRKLRQSNARVYFFEGEKQNESKPANETDDSVQEIILELEENDRLLRRVLHEWHGSCMKGEAAALSAGRWIDWRRYLRCWNAWRQVALKQVAERAQQEMILAKKREEIACRFFRLSRLSRALASWWLSTEESMQQRAIEEKELAEKHAHDQEMERIRKMLAAKLEVAERFADVYLCHRALRCWMRGLRSAKQDELAAEERQRMQSKIDAAIAARRAAVEEKQPKTEANSVQSGAAINARGCSSSTAVPVRHHSMKPPWSRSAVSQDRASTSRSTAETLKGDAARLQSGDGQLFAEQSESEKGEVVGAGAGGHCGMGTGSTRTASNVGKETEAPPAESTGGISVNGRKGKAPILSSPATRALEDAVLSGNHPYVASLQREAIEGFRPTIEGLASVETSNPTTHEIPSLSAESDVQDVDARGTDDCVSTTRPDLPAVVAPGECDGVREPSPSPATMEARAKERAQRREQLQARYLAARAAAEEQARREEEARLAQVEERKRAHRLEVIARRKEAKLDADNRAAAMRLAETQGLLAKMHHRLGIMRYHGWRPWIEGVGHWKLQTWRAQEFRRRRLLAMSTGAWWGEAEAALARGWRQRQRADAAHKRSLMLRGMRALKKVSAAAKHLRVTTLKRAFDGLWRAVEMQRLLIELSRYFRWEHLCSKQFRAWMAAWRAAADIRLLAESAREAEAWRHACMVAVQRSFRGWREAAVVLRAESQKAERRAAAWGRIHGWLGEGTNGSDDGSECHVGDIEGVPGSGTICRGNRRDWHAARHERRALTGGSDSLWLDESPSPSPPRQRSALLTRMEHASESARRSHGQATSPSMDQHSKPHRRGGAEQARISSKIGGALRETDRTALIAKILGGTDGDGIGAYSTAKSDFLSILPPAPTFSRGSRGDVAAWNAHPE